MDGPGFCGHAAFMPDCRRRVSLLIVESLTFGVVGIASLCGRHPNAEQHDFFAAVGIDPCVFQSLRFIPEQRRSTAIPDVSVATFFV